MITAILLIFLGASILWNTLVDFLYISYPDIWLMLSADSHIICRSL
mgnify:CR=1 FL=1